MTALTNQSMSALSVPHPSYDRSAAAPGIVHFGVGNFHRSHQAMYLDRLMSAGQGGAWAISGVGVLPHDAHMAEVMRAQDCLYTLVLRHPDGSHEPRVIGSIVEYLYAPADPERVFERLVCPATRIVSLTVTEGGYLKDPATGRFDPEHPSVRHDVAEPQRPHTAFGYLIEGLRRRRALGQAPFTVLSCDNLQGNGHVTRQTVVGLARLQDAELADWVEANVAFPNCMVDRITPATTDADRAQLAQEFGIEDAWPVPGEPFTQWIIEDDFTLGRPDLESVGAQFVPDVTPYELMKLRLLNASHQAIAYFGAPLGYVLVDETLRDDRVRRYLVRYMRDEAAPTLGNLPGIDLEAYMNTLIERFSNPAIRDTLVRLATDGSNRMLTFTIPAVRDNLAAGRDISLGAAMVAAWANYWALIANGQISGDQVPPDVYADAMRTAAIDPRPEAFIEIPELFGDLADDEVFRCEYLAARAAIEREGVASVLTSLVSQ